MIFVQKGKEKIMIEYIRLTQSAEEQIKDLFGEVYLVGIYHDENENQRIDKEN